MIAAWDLSSPAASTAAHNLGEAARIAHDMVERQILLTRELVGLTNGDGALSAARTGSAAAPVPTPAPGSDLARAIDDLRAEADDERRSLPSL